MHRIIADNLVLVFTFGMSLRGWRTSGLLDREWALYRALLPHYRKLTLLTYGGDEDRAILHALLDDDERGMVDLVCNSEGADPMAFSMTVPGRVRAAVGSAHTVVVKTNQMVGGEVAVKVTDELRACGKHVALIARGGYLWTRFVTYEHGPHSDTANDAAARERLLCINAEMVVGTTEDMVHDLAWRYGIDPHRTRVIPNYVLTDEPVAGASEREKNSILYAGQLVRRKRADILIEAAARMRSEFNPLVTLDIVGDGPERANLQQLAAKLGAPVVFHPRIPHRDLLARMSRCTVYAQASELEGHPKTVLEAMASGAPVVVADSPGLAGAVVHGSNGLRVAADADAFLTALSELIADEDWRELLGSTAARSVRAAYGIDTILQQEIAAHTDALAIGLKRTARAA